MDVSSEDLVPLLEPGEIRARVAELGAEITREYRGRDLVLVCVLRAAVVFFADLIREIPLPFRCVFARAASYGGGTESSGQVELDLDVREPLEGRHVLVVEDIVDTGRTARAILDAIEAHRPASLALCALLDKPSRREVDVPLRWRGFEVPDRFVVGYGIDFDDRFRDRPGVWMLP